MSRPGAHRPKVLRKVRVASLRWVVPSREGSPGKIVEIAEQQNTNLAVVAPGIAEALMATGLGLLAAIPAVVFYNKLSVDSDRIISGYEAFSDEFATILSRQLDS